MKVLSLYQPYATLWIYGLKQNETRSWPTKHRGQLGVHAAQGTPTKAKGYPANFDELCDMEPFKSALASIGYGRAAELPRGVILGDLSIVDCLPTDGWGLRDALPLLHGSDGRISPQENAFGDYSLGRYGWIARDRIVYPTPIKALGRQQIWTFDRDAHQGDIKP